MLTSQVKFSKTITLFYYCAKTLINSITHTKITLLYMNNNDFNCFKLVTDTKRAYLNLLAPTSTLCCRYPLDSSIKTPSYYYFEPNISIYIYMTLHTILVIHSAFLTCKYALREYLLSWKTLCCYKILCWQGMCTFGIDLSQHTKDRKPNSCFGESKRSWSGWQNHCSCQWTKELCWTKWLHWAWRQQSCSMSTRIYRYSDIQLL